MRRQLLNLTFLLLFCILMSTLIGCSQHDAPSMVLLNKSSLPCWFDICPGSTQKVDAMRKLATIPYVDDTSISDRSINTPGNYLHWMFISEVSDMGRLFFDDQLVSYINIYPRPVNSLSFNDIIEKYGTPKHVWAYSDCADSRWLYLALIYPDNGLYVVSFDADWRREESVSNIEARTVSEVIYYDPALIEDLLMNIEGVNWLGYGFTYNDIASRLQLWENYSENDILRMCY